MTSMHNDGFLCEGWKSRIKIKEQRIREILIYWWNFIFYDKCWLLKMKSIQGKKYSSIVSEWINQFEAILLVLRTIASRIIELYHGKKIFVFTCRTTRKNGSAKLFHGSRRANQRSIPFARPRTSTPSLFAINAIETSSYSNNLGARRVCCRWRKKGSERYSCLL